MITNTLIHLHSHYNKIKFYSRTGLQKQQQNQTAVEK